MSLVTAILVTGGEGVLGWHLAEKFLETGYKVFTTTKNGERPKYTSRNYTLDIRDRSSFNNLPRDVDIVIHAAAISRVGIAQTNPDLCLKVNVEGTLNLAEWILSLERPPLLIFLSSREVSYVPVDENHPTNPISVYGKSKSIIKVEKKRPYEIRNFIGNSSKARSLVGISSQIDFETMITEYIGKMRNLVNYSLSEVQE